MEILEVIRTIFDIGSIPTLIGVILYLENRYIKVLKAENQLKEKQIEELEKRSPKRLKEYLDSLVELYDRMLDEREQQMEEERNRARHKIKKLEKEVENLRQSIDMMDKYWSGDDYRYEILEKELEEKGYKKRK